MITRVCWYLVLSCLAVRPFVSGLAFTSLDSTLTLLLIGCACAFIFCAGSGRSAVALDKAVALFPDPLHDRFAINMFFAIVNTKSI